MRDKGVGEQALERLLKSENNLAGLCLTEQALQSALPRQPDSAATAVTSSKRCVELLGSYLAQVARCPAPVHSWPNPSIVVTQMLSHKGNLTTNAVASCRAGLVINLQG